MGKIKLRGKDLRKINYKSDRAKALAVDIISKHFKHVPKEELLSILTEVRTDPEAYLNDEVLGVLADELIEKPLIKERSEIALLREAGDFNIFGRKHISSNAYQQMEMAMRLPIARKGALMPDAHQGYGLPIGGVLAAKDAVIPYGVGLDIGCRMSLTLYDVNERYLNQHAYQFKVALKERTNFGTGGELGILQDHEVLESKVFDETKLLKQLHGKAVKQLGTSGSGNHFVEFGLVDLYDGNDFGIEPGKYLGLMAHSGSRGLGASIAKYYTDQAKANCLLPRQAGHLAWLDMQSELGIEYWLSMNLAGEYAKACHDRIHANLSKYLGIDPIAKVENHHNFAWKEVYDGTEYIVHRKGATPASRGELGVIPGSMATDGYIVRGKGDNASLNSASHGAGRKMSRKNARESFTGSALKKVLSSKKVTLIGGGVDESPIAYKDLEQVMSSQKSLVDTIGKFTPRIVRMDKS